MLLALAAVGLGATPVGAPALFTPEPSAPAAHGAPARQRPAGPLRIVAIGDSVPAGAACSGCTPFPYRYGERFAAATGTPVSVQDLAVGGLDSAGLLASLVSATPQAAAVATADVVLVTIGANDLVPARPDYAAGQCGGPDDLDCFRTLLPGVRAHLAAALERIAVLRGHAPTTVLVTDYWNVFEDGASAVSELGRDAVDDARTVTRAENQVLCAAAAAARATCVDLYAPFLGPTGDRDPTRLLAADGDHPSQAGHDLIAATLLAAYPCRPSGCA
ncbi:MAG TPA: SGNH/GDSL hydrolase family protein [Motilibacteraceae bacterium]|nr:SGNH/GDSL hydrolase family protein [Motilibacteraceae bacterium]